MFSCLLLAVLLGYAQAPRADVSGEQADEVRHLIEYLAASDCEMVRNGKPYSGEDGAKHVQRKYDYFRDKISSTEEFIELSATKSTMSGRQYEVHCPGQPPMVSADWLTRELRDYRSR